MATHSSILAWKIPGRRSLVGCSPWGRKESDTTERLHFHFRRVLDLALIFQVFNLKLSSSSMPAMLCHAKALQSCPTLRPSGVQTAGLLCPWGFSRQEYWNRLPRPLLGDLPDPGIKPTFLMSPALAGVFFATSSTWEAPKAHRKRQLNTE